MITLFDSGSTSFTTNGIGNLNDAILCLVTEERNGEYELELRYPINGKYYSQLAGRRIIAVKPNPYSIPQPFRIYEITKPINGIVTVNAEHISYDLSGYPVSPFVASGAQDAFTKLKNNSVETCPFTLTTDLAETGQMTISVPTSMRQILGSRILEEYGGEYEFDNYSVNLVQNRGANRGVSIRYGKNLTDLKQEENFNSVYTGVYPFWYSQQDGLVELSEKILHASGTYNFTRIYPLDLSANWVEKPTQTELTDAANKYMTKNNIGVPRVSLDVSFVPLSQTEEYKNFAILETVRLCDTVNVEFPELGVSATAKCIKTVYNVLTNKYESIELGESRSTISHTISNQKQVIEDRPSKAYMEEAIDVATQLISGGLGGNVIMRSSTGGKQPDEILIMDTTNVATATNVWRWNMNGFGYSSTGINGPYGTAITMDGHIMGSYITALILDAAQVKTGTLSSPDGKFSIKLDDGTFNFQNHLSFDGDSFTIRLNDGKTVEESISYKVEIISTNGGVFKNGEINTKLIARVYKGAEDVTDTIDANRFRWTRISNDTAGDSGWNTSHFSGTKEVTITSEDVRVRATFNCEIL